MLLTYIQAAPNSTDQEGSSSRDYHIQATGPAFPLGYASGDVELEIELRKCFIPSMRGSGRLYFELTEDEINEDLVDIVCNLHAPQPTYAPHEAEAVALRVKAAIARAGEGAPCEPSSQHSDVDEALVARIVAAVLAALKK